MAWISPAVLISTMGIRSFTEVAPLVLAALGDFTGR
jgi:hypothetical protein